MKYYEIGMSLFMIMCVSNWYIKFDILVYIVKYILLIRVYCLMLLLWLWILLMLDVIIIIKNVNCNFFV